MAFDFNPDLEEETGKVEVSSSSEVADVSESEASLILDGTVSRILLITYQRKRK